MNCWSKKTTELQAAIKNAGIRMSMKYKENSIQYGAVYISNKNFGLFQNKFTIIMFSILPGTPKLPTRCGQIRVPKTPENN